MTMVSFKFDNFEYLAFLDPFWITTTRNNNRGESGQPCLRPLLDLNEGDVAPLIKIEKDIQEMQAIIH